MITHSDKHEMFMRLALDEANRAFEHDEVPVGAIVRLGGDVVARGRDKRIETGDPAAHAEILALREAAQRLGDWRLENCTLYVTLEPCPMCAGALILSRIPCLVYGAPNLKMGAVRSLCSLLDIPGWNHSVEVVEGILRDECAEILTRFFSRKR